jgi:hypothetical protein
MFAAHSRVTITEELAGGFSGSRVFVVQPLRHDGLPELPAVVKLGPFPLVQQEWQAYRQQVHNRLPGVAAIQGPPSAPRDGGWAGLRYPLVGSGTFNVESLQQYYGQAGAGDLRYVLEMRLFRQLGALWRFNRPAPAFALRDSYDTLLPVNLMLRPMDPPAGAHVHLLDAESCQSSDLEPGDYVRLREFVVTEREGRGAEITLNLPGAGEQQARSYRLRLLGKATPLELEVGGPVEDLTCRVVNTRRAILAAHVLELWGLAFEVDAGSFTLPGGRALPNPLARLPAILAARPTVRIAAIHGDLNPQNILVDAETREVRLIDFADARQDHVLHDLLRLETGIVTRLLPQSLHDAGLPPEVVVGLYERLAQEARATAEYAGPALAKAAAMLAAVRRTARDYLYDGEEWLEYWQGLSIYLLGAQKYGNLSPTAKKVGFLAAATTQQLLTQGALRAVQAPAPPPTTPAPNRPAPEVPPAARPAALGPQPFVPPPLHAETWYERLAVPWWLPAAVALAAVLILIGALSLLGDGDGVSGPALAASRAAAESTATAGAALSPAATPRVTSLPAADPATLTPTPPRTTAADSTTPDCALHGAGSSITILLDLSQSMHGAKLDSAILALKRFVACLHPSADIAVYTFADDVQALQPAGPVADVGEPLRQRLDTLFAGGESALYDAVCRVLETVSTEEEGRQSLFILLSDGPDTGSTDFTTEEEMLGCISEEVALYTIAYGPDAEGELLARMAEVAGGVALQADAQTIDRVLQGILLQQ